MKLPVAAVFMSRRRTARTSGSAPTVIVSDDIATERNTSAFPRTSITEVMDSQGKGEQATRALANLCQNYWYPLYAFVRRRGHSLEDAQDITQGFFASFLAGPAFGGYDPSRGKLRSYLLGALKHFESNWRRDRETIKAGRDVDLLSFEWLEAEQQYQAEPRDVASPDVLFDRRWAMMMLEHVDKALREEYVKNGKADLFEAVHAHIHGNLDRPTEDAAMDLKMSLAAFKMAGSRMRDRAREILRAQIGLTVVSSELIDAEITYLLSLFETRNSNNAP